MQRVKVGASERYFEDLEQVYSQRVEGKIRKIVDLLSYTPEIGSKLLPKSIREEFGEDVLKFVVDPFDLIYRYDKQRGEVRLLALIHQARAW